jgi:hypothetical protein
MSDSLNGTKIYAHLNEINLKWINEGNVAGW